ncbi:MAG: hypothetical protein ACLFNQ_12935, partial [Spirochaetaceae bacterium]
GGMGRGRVIGPVQLAELVEERIGASNAELRSLLMVYAIGTLAADITRPGGQVLASPESLL